MSFLLTQIAFLLLAAFLCGLVLSYLWMRSRYEDVTLEFEQLEQKSRASRADPGEQPSADLRALAQRFEALERAIASAQPSGVAPVDLAPVLERLSSIERQLSSVGPIPVDLELVNSRIGALDRKLGALSQGAPVQIRAESEGSTSEALSSQLAALSASVSALSAPQAVDLSGVIERLAALERRCEEMPAPADLGPLQAELLALSSRLGERPSLDLSPVTARLDAIDAALSAQVPAQRGSEGELSSQLAALSVAVSALSAPQAVDLSGVIERLSALERRCEEMPAKTQPCSLDLSSVTARLDAIDAALSAPQAVDLSGITERLSALERQSEQGRAAVAPPPAQPSAEVLIDAVRVTEGRNLLSKAAFGKPDDIEIIKGIGPKLTEMLHKIGVYYFWQIAAWSEDDVAYVDGLLEAFQGRIVRDAWVAQAIELAKDPNAAKPPGK